MINFFISVFIATHFFFTFSLVNAATLKCKDDRRVGFIKDNASNRYQPVKLPLLERTMQFTSDFAQVKGLDGDFIWKCKTPFQTKPQAISCLSFFDSGESLLFNKYTKRYELSEPKMAGFVLGMGDGSSFSQGVCQ
tara:strand:+ start:420 stop:827 length:408 start_codon:yes stop_codon:yes gene_type:complete